MTKVGKHNEPSARQPGRSHGEAAPKGEADGGHKHHKHHKAAWRDDFKNADRNHNGKLSKSELKIVPKAERHRLDKNHNGVVGRHEFHAGFDHLDKNNDGDLSKGELRGHHGHAGGHPHHDGPKGDHAGHQGHAGGHPAEGGHHAGGSHHAGGGHHAGGHGGHTGGVRARHVNVHDPASTAPSGGPDRPQQGQVNGDTDLTISSFNVLGSSHTTAGGEKPGMASGPERMRSAVQLLDQHKVDVVGFQEFQPDQVQTFQKEAGDKYGLYPGMQLGRGPNVNSIAWRKDKYDLVKADTIKIPYFNGHEVKMPVIRLRDKQTGQEFYVANFHNPASTKNHPGNQHWRDVATQREVDLANRLRKETNLPLFITGDMNERSEFYTKMKRGSPGMHASAELNNRNPGNQGIDWIFGSPNVKFTRHVRDRGSQVQRTTDHPMMVSQAHIQDSDG